jgi:hypothetical protein
VKRGELLVAIADLEPIEARGMFERHCSLRWEGLRASAAGGRWAERGAFEVLYLGRPRDSVIVEAYRHLVEDDLDAPAELASAVLERRLFTMEVAVPNVLDLTTAEARERIQLGDEQLRSPVGEYTPCQAIGAAAHQLGLGGILAPAATRLGDTLALFPLNVAIEQWPVVTSSEIWHGLPADPRRLRLAELSRGSRREPVGTPL